MKPAPTFMHPVHKTITMRSRLNRISPFLLLVIFLVFWTCYGFFTNADTITLAKIILLPFMIVNLLLADFAVWNYYAGKRKPLIWIIEGVLAAAALRCVGGQMQGRLVFRNEDEKARAAKWGIKDLNRKYRLHELVSGDVVFSATGVTDGSMLRGVHTEGNFITTESVVMRSTTGTVRWIKARHRREKG